MSTPGVLQCELYGDDLHCSECGAQAALPQPSGREQAYRDALAQLQDIHDSLSCTEHIRAIRRSKRDVAHADMMDALEILLEGGWTSTPPVPGQSIVIQQGGALLAWRWNSLLGRWTRNDGGVVVSRGEGHLAAWQARGCRFFILPEDDKV